jgi:SNF2 family DNA or RNA helicase
LTATVTDTEHKFVPAPWQLEDLAKLYERNYSANWSEMGCFKTSSIIWLADKQLYDAGIENPSILIITTPSGKGTYYEAIFGMMYSLNYNYTLLDVNTRGVFLVLPGGKKVRAGDKLADKINVPHIILSHYHVFTKTNKGEPERHKVSRLILKDPATGVVKMKPWTMADYLIERNYDFNGLDEAHRIKNRKAKWTENIKKLKSDRRHVMTGTGFINRPDEIWSLLNFLDPKEFSSFWRFRDHFCEIDTWSGFEKVVGILPENRDEFRDLVRTIGVRRTLDEVMPHIKKPLMVRREVDLNSTQRKMFDQIKKELKTLDQKGEPIHSPNVLSALNRMRQIAVATPELVDDYYDEKLDKRVFKVKLVEPSSKLDDLMEILEGLQWDDEERQQVVVFSNFKDPLSLLEQRLLKAGIPYIWMKESDNETVRYHKWFETFPKKQHMVFMSTLQLGSESINLTSARHIVFLDRSWSPKDNAQGIGRVRRPGQEGQPVVINIEARHTTDQKLERTNYEKQGWFNEIFGDEDSDAEDSKD